MRSDFHFLLVFSPLYLKGKERLELTFDEDSGLTVLGFFRALPSIENPIRHAKSMRKSVCVFFTTD